MAGCISPTKTCKNVNNGLDAILISNGITDFNGIATGNVSQHVSSYNTVLKNNSHLPVLSASSGKIDNIRYEYQP